MTRTFRYPAAALAADYGRGLGGAAICLAPLALTPTAAPVAWALGAGAALFLVYFGRTVCRQLTQIELDETGVRARGPLGATIRWDRLRTLQLGYYSTRGDREGGWMQLKLGDAKRAIRADSGIDGFVDLVRAAVAQAVDRGVDLDPATRANIVALGIAPAEDA